MINTVNRKSSKVKRKRKINSFKDLDTWKVSHKVTLEIYKLSRNFPKDEKFGITSQIRRASSSVTANIAEGWGRYHYADKIRFYYQARGSNTEVQNFLILAKDLGYCSKKKFNETFSFVIESLKVINGLIRSVEKQK